MSSGSEFHSTGPAQEKDRRPQRSRLWQGTHNIALPSDLRVRRASYGVISIDTYAGARASDFQFKKKQFSVSKKVKFRFDSVSLLATLNSMKSQYIERKCGERTVKMAQLVR